MRSTLKHYASELLPPVIFRFLRRRLSQRLFWLAARSSGLTSISTIAELDDWIARADTASETSDDALRQVLGRFRYQAPINLPADPFSPDYVQAQWALYKHISGRSEYDAASSERTPFDLETFVHRPFPYSTLSCQTVGEQLVRQGLVLNCLDLPPHSSILEFGPGWGNLTLELARMGHQVTAVDIEPNFIELIQRRAQQSGLEVNLACDTMLSFESHQTYDAVIFFECFHHCADHLKLLERLHTLVKDDGVVVFGFEPITPTPHAWGDYPWGVRLDGMSVWSIRKFGWLELGFTDDYFREALRRTGWRGEIKNFQPWQSGTIAIAHKARSPQLA